MDEQAKEAVKTYRWALYLLIFLLGILIGRNTSDCDQIFYVGPDPNEAHSAVIGVRTIP